MSENTKAALEDALQAHIADRSPGVYVTGYAIVVCGAIADKPDFTSYRYMTPAAQSRHSTIGLAAMLNQAANDLDHWE